MLYIYIVDEVSSLYCTISIHILLYIFNYDLLICKMSKYLLDKR